MVQIVRFCLLLALFLGVGKQTEKITDGFALSKLAHRFLEESDPLFDETPLEQRFFYLAKGGQSYVFASEDGRYVLKFFRASKLHNLELFARVSSSAGPKIEREKKRLDKIYRSYQIANEQLQEETGLIGIHLSPSSLATRKLKIIDKLGIEHTIGARCTPFVLQKRGILLKEKLTQLAKEGKIETAKHAINQTFALVKRCKDLGIRDQDPNLAKNFGFVGDMAIELDGGSFSASGAFAIEKLRQSKDDLKSLAPDLSVHLEDAYRRFAHEVD